MRIQRLRKSVIRDMRMRECQVDEPLKPRNIYIYITACAAAQGSVWTTTQVKAKTLIFDCSPDH